MQEFINRFSIALNQDKTEAIINFFQNVPIIPMDNSAAPEVTEMQSQIIPVANLALTGQCARNLADTLSKMLAMDVPAE